ncbi:endonuclease domain-containing protein [Arthrobacter sp. CJ23]|uniref:endonuclease domain-containing protein n=1 Tax=Arthrobacter sp. CJ23 TaxID=2972479 RepID=UPI00215D55A0|nr:endonuclease domain-containing protein [Arthrobacter sp. CJ23]UVJ38803.1 endonuclease domain-containing protein [Arthrobacter sp. CJ23]
MTLQDHAFIHLTQLPGKRAVRRKGVKGHQLRLHPDEITHGRMVTCTSALRTWFDLASVLDDDDLVIAGDHLLRRRNPDATPGQLDAYLESRRGAAGHHKAKNARKRMRTGTDSPKETEVRLLLVKHGLPEPGINLPIFDETGGWIQDPDMSYEELKIAIQYDGGHHARPAQRRMDIARDENALELGWRVVRLTQADLDVAVPGAEPRAVTRVRTALKERGWTANGNS